MIFTPPKVDHRMKFPEHAKFLTLSRNPDYFVILAWNFAEPIMAKHTAFAENGGKFIIPLPEVTVR